MATRPTVAFVTLGCARNEVDSEELAGRLAADGWDVVEEADSADAVLVNTCGFVAAAKKEFEIQRQVTQVLRTKLRPFQLALVQQKWDEAEKALTEIEEALPEGNRQIDLQHVGSHVFQLALAVQRDQRRVLWSSAHPA